MIFRFCFCSFVLEWIPFFSLPVMVEHDFGSKSNKNRLKSCQMVSKHSQSVVPMCSPCPESLEGIGEVRRLPASKNHRKSGFAPGLCTRLPFRDNMGPPLGVLLNFK